MNVLLSDCPSMPSQVSRVQEFVEQIQVTWFGPAADRALQDPESRQDLLGQLALLDGELRDLAGDAGASALKPMREELLSYLKRLTARLDTFNPSRAVVAKVEQEFCEFVELLYDYDLATASS